MERQEGSMHPEREERRTSGRRAADRRGPEARQPDLAKERLRHLYEISQILTAFESVEKTLPAVLGVVTHTVPLDRAILIVRGEVHPSTTVWTPDGVSVEGLSGAESDARVSFDYLSAGTGARLHTRRSLIALPLVVDHQRPFGILQLEGAVLDVPGLGFVNAMINQLAIAIQRKQAETERETLFQKELNARAEAEAANRAKDDFLAIVSHELRTPLNAILGHAGLLGAGKLDPAETTRAIEVIFRNAETQKRLIADLLDVQSIVTGKLRLEMSAVNVVHLVESARATLQPAAAAKSLDVQLSLGSSTVVVQGDADRLRQVVWNLLSNAIKFTPDGGHVQIEARYVDDEQAEIVVSDTGPGIRAEFLPHVFERFRQADSSPSRRYGGLGLGLSIVQKIVDLHGGTVTAANRGPESGALFTVTLRRQAGVAPALGRRSDDESGVVTPVLDGMRVLVVEDMPDDREVLARILEVRGAKVTMAASAAEGLVIVERERPDVVLSDIAMPDEDGCTFLRRLRALPRDSGGETPAVAVTAFAGSDERVHTRAAGFQAHLSKPIDPVELARVMAALAPRKPR
jgi:signal transduction histidine kinase/ActR/RegA family two-component response regulator